MSLFPNESYSFPDLSEGATPRRRKRGVPPEPSPESEENLPATPQPSADETATHAAPNETATTDATPNVEAAPLAESLPAADPVEPVPLVKPRPPIKLVRRVRMRPSPNATVEPPEPVEPPVPAAPVESPVVLQPAVPVTPVKPARPKRVLPLMPVMPVVPDELAHIDSPYVESEPEPIEAPQEYEVPEYEFSSWGEEPRAIRRRRRNKLIRFIIFEALSFGLLLFSAKLQAAQQFSESSLTLVYKILMFAAAAAVVMIPVVFYALPPTLPPTRR